MGTGRMEAFSDGVIAIIITIMVLELKVPHGTDLAALGDGLPELANYVLSVVYVAIYRNNHHHLLHACDRINGAIMWGNGRESFPSWTSPLRPRSGTHSDAGNPFRELAVLGRQTRGRVATTCSTS